MVARKSQSAQSLRAGNENKQLTESPACIAALFSEVNRLSDGEGPELNIGIISQQSKSHLVETNVIWGPISLEIAVIQYELCLLITLRRSIT